MKSSIFFSAFLIFFLYGSILFCRDFKFNLGEFEITVQEQVLLNDRQIGKPYRMLVDNYKIDGRLKPIQQVRAWNTAVISLLNGKVFKWKGTTFLTDINLPLNLNGIQLTLDRTGMKIIAMAGTATIDRILFPHNEFSYITDNCEILLSTESILLNPERANGFCEIEIREDLFASKNPGLLRINNDNVTIHPDGSIFEINFSLSYDYGLKFSDYNIHVRSHYVKVRIGDTFSDLEDRGVQFYCFTSLNSLTLEGLASLKPNNKYLKYEFNTPPGTTIGPVEPECDYELTVDSIYQVFEYRIVPVSTDLNINPQNQLIQDQSPQIQRNQTVRIEEPLQSNTVTSTLQNQQKVNPLNLQRQQIKEELVLINYDSFVLSDLIIPGVVTDMDGNQIYLIDLKLKIDQSGNLFGKIEFPRIKINDAYSVETSGDNAWVYFDNWLSIGKHYECTSQGYSTCTKYTFRNLKRAGYLNRCGVTLLNGEFFIKAPQTDADYVHCKFWGGLTITPLGIAGSLTSGKYLVVKNTEESIDQSELNKLFNYPDLQGIIDQGNNIPTDPPYLFKLSELQIQKMTIDSILFCQSKIFSSKINYTVHFPYPSFFNAGFIDTTLTDDGRFHFAYGPEFSEFGTYTSSQVPSSEYINMAIKPSLEMTYNTTGKILWFWRLPFTLYRKTIFVTHMDHNRSRIEIVKADLGIIPLTSEGEDHKNGVVFSADLTADGDFNLIGFMRKNYFGKFNSQDFECDLNSVNLAELDTQPADREFDVEWSGTIKFPFFKETDVSFKVRNIVPELTEKINKMSSSVRVGTINDSLYVQLKDMDYSYDKSNFFCDHTRYKRLFADENETGSLKIASFIGATLVPDDNEPDPGPDTISTFNRSTRISGECVNNDKITVEQMIDFVRSEVVIDLVCYDEEAHDDRSSTLEAGIDDLCDGQYLYGTYQVVTEIDGNSIVVLNIPNAKYYFETISSPRRIIANNSPIDFSSELNYGHTTKRIDVPGLRLYYNDDEFSGKIDLNTNIVPDMPIGARSELEMYLNPHCNYFYVWGSVDFKFYFRFDAHLLIAHAPFSKIERLTERLAGYAHIPEAGLKEDVYPQCYAGSDRDNCLVSSLMVSGGFGIPLAIVKVNLGAGFWYTTNSTGVSIGGYNMASAELDLCVILIRLSGTLEAKGDWLEDSDNYLLKGVISGKGCISAIIGHCYGNAYFTTEYSTRDGFSAEFDGVDSGCDWGGCD